MYIYIKWRLFLAQVTTLPTTKIPDHEPERLADLTIIICVMQNTV